MSEGDLRRHALALLRDRNASLSLLTALGNIKSDGNPRLGRGSSRLQLLKAVQLVNQPRAVRRHL
jgi:hypothetical protein